MPEIFRLISHVYKQNFVEKFYICQKKIEILHI